MGRECERRKEPETLREEILLCTKDFEMKIREFVPLDFALPTRLVLIELDL